MAKEKIIPADISLIVKRVIAAIQLHIPDIVIHQSDDNTIIAVLNPANNQAAELLRNFTPARDKSIGYRVMTLDAVTDILKVLLATPAGHVNYSS